MHFHFHRTFFSTKWIIVFALAALISCKNSNNNDGGDATTVIEPGTQAQTETQNALINAQEGDIIEFGPGTFEFDRTLTMDAKTNVTLRGQGRDQTILSFSGQTTGGDALLITNSSNIVTRDFTIRDAVGDALKFRDSDSIVMYRIGAEWSGEPSEENGSYGLYPVLSNNILIEECYAFGASDAGIYVGQSDKAIVRNSIAEGNVAGIEIENTTNADVHGNTVTDNTGGILVFDLPGLTQSGAGTRVFDNELRNNNRGNFAPEGGIVAQVPAGTGIMVLSTKQVEIFDNTVEENNVIGTGVFSYASLVALGQIGQIQDPAYDPFPADIYIHNNSYSRSNTYAPADQQSFFGNLLVNNFASNPIPDIMLDGFFALSSEDNGTICAQNNSDASFVNLNIPDDFPNNVSFDAAPHDCSQDPLEAVEINVPDF